MPTDSIEKFIRLLKKSSDGAVFNPWWQVDRENDVDRNAPAIRRRHLRAYLRERRGKAKLVVIGEALGYRGGHFSGIPMTSERILLGKKKDVLTALYERRYLPGRVRNGGHRPPLQIIAGVRPRRTSKPGKCPDGFSEPTATIVWSLLLRLGLKPQQFVLWNACPWHSFDPRRGMLSNRMPTQKEQSAGLSVLKAFLDLFPCDEIVALGNVAASQLKELNVESHRVRHPASGGAKLFRQQIEKIVKEVGQRGSRVVGHN
jgi:uracil-DNA glycosylase